MQVSGSEVHIHTTKLITAGGGEQARWKWSQVRECLRDPQYYFFILFNFLVMIPNGGITTFNNLIMKSFNFSSFDTILYYIPSQAIAIFFVLGPGICVQFYPHSRFPWALFVTAMAIAVFLYVGLCPQDTDKWTKWAVYLFALPFATAMFLIWPLMSINVAGRTKKTFLTASALVTYSECLHRAGADEIGAGNILGSQIFKDPPRYIKGLVGISIAMILYMILLCAWWAYYVWENKRRDRIVGASGHTLEEQEYARRVSGEKDMTDREVRIQRSLFRCADVIRIYISAICVRLLYIQYASLVDVGDATRSCVRCASRRWLQLIVKGPAVTSRLTKSGVPVQHSVNQLSPSAPLLRTSQPSSPARCEKAV